MIFLKITVALIQLALAFREYEGLRSMCHEFDDTIITWIFISLHLLTSIVILL